MSLYPLPPIVTLNDYAGDWSSYQNALYQEFRNDIATGLSFLGLPVECKYWQPINNMHRTFWHLITHSPSDDRNDEDREVDMRRCEQLCWIAHIIKNYTDSAIKCWENKRGSDTHVILWLERENYMIILAKRKGYWLLKTAYPHGENTRKRNLKEEASKYADPRNS